MANSRQFIPYATDVAIGPVLSQPRHCKECAILLSVGRYGQLCDVCWSMLKAIATTYFVCLHRKWSAENDRLVANKARLLDSRLYFNSPEENDEDDDGLSI